MKSRLTKREREIAHWMYEGKTSGEIGVILGISRRTVEKHGQGIYQKLGVTRRVELVHYLRETAGEGAPLLAALLAILPGTLANFGGALEIFG